MVSSSDGIMFAPPTTSGHPRPSLQLVFLRMQRREREREIARENVFINLYSGPASLCYVFCQAQLHGCIDAPRRASVVVADGSDSHSFRLLDRGGGQKRTSGEAILDSARALPGQSRITWVLSRKSLQAPQQGSPGKLWIYIVWSEVKMTG